MNDDANNVIQRWKFTVAIIINEDADRTIRNFKKRNNDSTEKKILPAYIYMWGGEKNSFPREKAGPEIRKTNDSNEMSER